VRFREVFRYELGYRLRRPLTWVFFALQGLLTLWTSLATYEDGDELFNAPVRLAGGAAIAGMAGILIAAAIFGRAASCDFEAEMDAQLFTSRLTKAEYLGARFLSACTVQALVLLAIPLTQALATQLPFLTPAMLGPFRLGALVQPFLLFLLPNLVFVGAILFTIAALSRQTIPVYLGAIGIFVAYLVAVNSLSEAETPLRLALGDPLGISVLQRLIRFWTPAESNTRLVGFPAVLLLNRALWLAVAAGVLALLYRRFPFAHPVGGGKRGRRRPSRDVGLRPGAPRSRPTSAIPLVQPSFGRRTRIRQTLAVARRSLGEVALGRAGLVTLLVAMGLTLLWGWNVGTSIFDTSTWPVTYLVTEEVLGRRNTPLIVLLIAVHAGELVWKDRDVGAAEVADAAPVPVSAMLLGRYLALLVMLATMQAAFLIAGVLLQTLQGYTRFELGLYLEILFGLSLVHWALIAALAMVVHVVVNQKYLGHVVVLLAFVFTMTSSMFGVFHNLLLYGKDPGWTYSDMNGFGRFLGPFLAFKLYWAAWAFLLAVVANLLWVRGRETRLRQRFLEARARFRGAVARSAGVAALLILLVGGFVFYNTNVLNEYRSPREAQDPQAEYETRYKRYQDAPQPTLTAAELRVEIYPDEPAVDLRGTYRLVNRTDARLEAVHVTFLSPDIQANAIAFDRASSPALVDDERHFRIYTLERPLAPGDSLELAFDLSFRPRGFTNDRPQTKVVANGTHFDRSWLPAIGYQPLVELTDDEPRRRRGLEPRRAPAPDDAAARAIRWAVRNEDLVDLDAVVGTAVDQTVIVSPGVQQKGWTENGRRYVHFRTEAPSPFGANVFSARWAVREERWNDVALRIFHHPAHGSDLDRTLRSMKASLECYGREFGPYPYEELRMVEIPRYGGFGHAMTATISFTEDYFQSRVEEGQVDMPFYGTAHEVAHTWWDGQIRAARVPGQQFLSESLANYCAMVLTEKTFGPEAARTVYDFQVERYLQGRAEQSGEVPVLDVEEQPYIAYRKGAIAMVTLRERLGEERLHGALRRFQEAYRGGGPPYATSRDLYAELCAVTPDSLQPLLEDLFETITLWDLKTEEAHFEPTDAGDYLVSLDVTGRKGRSDGIGTMTEVPMDDLVEIGVFAAEGDGLGQPLYLEPHRIQSGRQTITLRVPRPPFRAGVDPYGKLIERERGDNVSALRAEHE